MYDDTTIFSRDDSDGVAQLRRCDSHRGLRYERGCRTPRQWGTLHGGAGITDLEVNWWTIDGGGVMRSTGAEFELSATIGQPDAGMIKGGDFTLTGGFWFPVVAGDGNGDGVVNLVDYDVFEGCLAGPGGGSPDDLCSSFDTDSSGAVDLRDFAVVQTTFTAP